MIRIDVRALPLALLVLVAACSHATAAHSAAPAVGSPAAPSAAAAIAKARADSARYPYTEADVRFMQGMIGHHAQAIVISGWAPSHDASPAVRTLAARIINAQKDEIATIQTWLRDRQKPVPEATPHAMPGMQHDERHEMQHDMNMGGTEHETRMPGMLTPQQMAQLDAARGKEFDRLFLTFMIQHHQGAITMVKQLFDSYGAAQDQLVFKLASDINVDQTTEVARMQRMLVALTFGGDAR